MNELLSILTHPVRTEDKDKAKDFTPEELRTLDFYFAKEPPILMLLVSEIKIDWSYQTRNRMRMFNEIRDNFLPGKLQTLKVSRRPDGSYYVFDGATRVLALEERGDMVRKLRCEVFDTPGQAIEALLFDWFNGRDSHENAKLENRLKALSVGGQDNGFVEKIEACGFSLIGGGRGTRINGATHMIQTWELDDNGEAMGRALFAIRNTWRDSHQIKGFVVLGIAQLYHYIHRPLDEQMRKALNRIGPEEIDHAVKQRWARIGGKRLLHPAERPPLITLIIAEEINKHPGKGGKIDIDKLTADVERERRKKKPE
jgi:hypothetical protein